MKNERPNLVAGRLSKMAAAPGKSAYAKNRLGIVLGEGAQEPVAEAQLADVPVAPAAPPPAAAPVETAAKPLPVSSAAGDAPTPAPAAAMPLDFMLQLQRLDDLASEPAITASSAAVRPAPAPDTRKKTASPMPWELSEAAAASVPGSMSASQPQGPDRARTRAESTPSWENPSAFASSQVMRSQRSRVMHYAIMASPALGGVLLILVIWVVWAWINTSAPAPRQAAASPTPAHVASPARTTAVRAPDSARNAPGDRVKPANAVAWPLANSASNAVASTTTTTWPPAANMNQPWSWLEPPRATATVPATSTAVVTPAAQPTPPQATQPVSPTPASQPKPASANEIKYREAPPGLRLTGIVKLSRGAAANINGRFLHVGDEFDDAKLVKIGKFTVEMELAGERFVLGFNEEAPQPSTPPQTPTTMPAATPAPPPATPQYQPPSLGMEPRSSH